MKKKLLPVSLLLGWLTLVPLALAETPNDSIMAELRLATDSAELALGKIKQFEGTFLESVKITAPLFDDVGVLGSTEFGGADAKVFLQKLGNSGGIEDWVLAFQLPNASLSSLAPAVANTIADDLEFASPVLIFSQTQARLSASSLTERAREFYGEVFQDASFQLQIIDGINLVTSAQARSGSEVDKKMKMVGIDIPQVVLQGVILKNFDADELNEAKENGKLMEAMRKNSELRASIPNFRITALPKNCTSGQASLIVTGQPGVGIQFDMTMISDGNRRDFDCQLKFAKADLGANKLSIHGTAKGDALWQDALGIKGVTLQSVELEISIDSQQKAGFGTRAQMKLGPRFVDVTGGVEFHAVTGALLRGYFKGSMDRLTSADLVAIANATTSKAGLGKVKRGDLPDFELRDMEFMFAPLGGSADLGIEAGYSIKGDLYLEGSRFASCDAIIDQSSDNRVVMIKADIGDIDLGALALKKTNVDVKMSKRDAYYRLQGYAKVFDAERYAEVDMSATHMYIRIDDKLGGVYETSFEYRAEMAANPTWYVKASFDNQLSDDLGQQLSSDIRDWAKQRNREFQQRQQELTNWQNKVRSLDTRIAQARRDVQSDRQRNEQKLASARRTVSDAQRAVDSMRQQVKTQRANDLSVIKGKLDSASSAMRSLKSKRDKAKKAYDKAKKAYKNAKVLDKPKKKIAQGKMKIAYEAAKGKYSAAKIAYDAAKLAYDKAARAANRVPVDADPKVAAAIAALKSAEVGLKAVQAAMNAAHRIPVDKTPSVLALIEARDAAIQRLENAKRILSVSNAALQKGSGLAAWTANNAGNAVSIQHVQFETKLTGMLQGSKVELQVDARIAGKPETIYVDVEAPTLDSKNLIDVLTDELKRKLL